MCFRGGGSAEYGQRPHFYIFLGGPFPYILFFVTSVEKAPIMEIDRLETWLYDVSEGSGNGNMVTHLL